MVEIDERVNAYGEVLVEIDEQKVERQLRQVFERYQCTGQEGHIPPAAIGTGNDISLAIVFMHGYKYPQHEALVASIARKIGFRYISTSHSTSPLMKIVGRGDTTVVDAYLSPVLRRYVDQVNKQVNGTENEILKNSSDSTVRLQFMQSHGGLTDARLFQGKV